MQNPGTGHRSAELWDIGAEKKIFLAGRTLAAGFTQRKRIILVGSANYDFANSLPNFSDTICWGLCDDVFPHTSEHQLQTMIKCLTCLPTLRCWRCRANMTSLLLVFLQITIDYGYNRLPSLSKQFVSRIQQNFIFYLDTVFAWSKHIIFYLHSH